MQKMMWTRIILALVVLGGLAVVSLSYLNPSETAQTASLSPIESAARAQVGRPVSVREEFRKEEAGWVFVCGTVTEADGTDLVLSAELESADFCALRQSDAPDTLTEFDFGSTDMPAMDWLETYSLPATLLNE